MTKRKENPKIRWHLSDSEKAEIRRLTLDERMTAAAICRAMHLNRNTVRLAKKKMNLPSRIGLTPEQERKILRLLPTCGMQKVAAAMGLSAHAVNRVARSHHFQRQCGRGHRYPKISPARANQLRQDIVNHADHAVHLAKKFAISYPIALRTVKEVLGVTRLRGGPGEPLASDCPQVPRTFEHAAELLQLRRDTPLPPFPDEIVDAVLLCIDPAELRKIAEAVPAEIFVKSIASFRAQFAAALTKRIGASNVEKARAWLEENSVSAQGSWLH